MEVFWIFLIVIAAPFLYGIIDTAIKAYSKVGKRKYRNYEDEGVDF